jgi:hypothetical protein
MFAFVIGLASMPAPVHAQDGRSKHWGASVFFNPQWKVTESLREMLFDGEGPIEGEEFTVGVVRGSRLGGEWGVSFLRKKINDTTLVEAEENCFESSCSSFSRTQVFSAVRLEGVEFHWFVPFVTIAERVQIGITAGAGVANVKGTIEETRVSTNTSTFNNQTQTQTDIDNETLPAKEALWPLYPLGKVEGTVSVTAAPGLKVRVSGGFNFPGVGVRIGAVYLIGAR